MIVFPIEVGIIGWVSTAIFWVAGVIAVWGCVKILFSRKE